MTATANVVCLTCRQPTIPDRDGQCLWCRDDRRLGPGWQQHRLVPVVRGIAEDSP